MEEAKTYIEGAFDCAENPHDVSVETHQESVDTPTEDTDTSFNTNIPCSGGTYVSYTYLGRWWRDYTKCHLMDPRGCALLLTGKDRGFGTAEDSHYSVAEDGMDLCFLPSPYTQLRNGSNFVKTRTELHEPGHALLGKGTSFERDAGTVTGSSGN